jgi:hypothetical protein
MSERVSRALSPMNMSLVNGWTDHLGDELSQQFPQFD